MHPVRTLREALEASHPDLANTASAALWRARNRLADSFERSLDAICEFEKVAAGGRTQAVVGTLRLGVQRLDGSLDDLGLASCRVVTLTGAGFFVDALQGLTNPAEMRYHGIGTSNAAESISNTALVSELSTQYAATNTRPRGTATEAAGNAATYESTTTIAVSAGAAITEHGLFNTATRGEGVLLDRSVFAPINLAAGESLAVTYQLSFTAGN